LGDEKPVPIPRSHSGSLYLNDILGGGFPKGRINEIYGPESSGKTTIALHAIAEVQKAGGVACFIDAEHALDLVYAKALGVKTEELILAQPDTAEDALQIAERAIKAGVDIYVVDSVASLVPRAELEGDIGDNHMGQLARLMSTNMKRLANATYKSGSIGIWLNQIRMKIGVMFGNPETTSGGQALKFYASVRLDIRPKEIIKNGENPLSRRTQITVVKSKVSTPHRKVEIDMDFGKGIAKSGEIVDIGSDLGVIQKGGAWYTFSNGEKVNGRSAAKEYLEANPAFMDELDKMLSEMMTPQFDEELIEEPDLDDMPEDIAEVEERVFTVLNDNLKIAEDDAV
jgi:recombination protein RecA